MGPTRVIATTNRTDVDGVARRITVLDGWRGVSILLVIYGHFATERYWNHSPINLNYRIADALSTFGVCIFFVISGLIITKLALREQDASGQFSVGNFYKRRFFRIVPPYFLYLSCILLLTAGGMIAQHYAGILWAAAFLCDLPQAECGWFGGHSWSLAYEEQFYLLFPLLFVSLGRRMSVTICVLFTTLLAIPVLRYVLRLGPPWYEVCHAAFYLSFICVGALVATLGDTMKQLSVRRHAGKVACGAALILVGLVLLEAVSRAHPSVWRYQQARMLLTPTLEPLCIAWLVGSSLYAANWFTRLLNTWAMQFVGMISYSLYLWQELFTADPSNYFGASWLMFPPLMIICAALSYYFIERPASRFAKRIAGSRGSVAVGWKPMPEKP